MTAQDWERTVNGLKLPPGTHAEVLGGFDVVTGEYLTRTIVWADRPYDECPRCGEPVARVVEDCPVSFDTGAGQGGAIEEYSQQHRCGLWLGVWSAEAAPGAAGGELTGEDVTAAARDLAETRAGAIARERAAVREDLLNALRDALTRLAEPLEDEETAEDRAEEVRTGSEVDPGVYQEDGQWLAWEYAPAGDGETITVTASDLTGLTLP